MGDMARAAAPGKYPLVYLVFNTIYNLLTQDDQVRCLRTRPGTSPTVASSSSRRVPSAWLRRNQFVDVEHVATGMVVLDVNRYDPVTQILDETQPPAIPNDGPR